jgi:hypothetical protein
MATEVMTEKTEAGLATAVRGVALDVRRLIQNGGGHPDTVAAVYRRIDGLRDQLRHLPYGTLHRWLENLDRELEAI